MQHFILGALVAVLLALTTTDCVVMVIADSPLLLLAQVRPWEGMLRRWFFGTNLPAGATYP
jgi:hypothetical protein